MVYPDCDPPPMCVASFNRIARTRRTHPLSRERRCLRIPRVIDMKRREFLATGLSMAGAFAMRSAYGQPAPSNRAAVVIGVDKVGSFQPLRAARSGAIAVADWLRGEGFEVALLVDDPNPVRTADLKAAIKTFVNRGTIDQLVIYFY